MSSTQVATPSPDGPPLPQRRVISRPTLEALLDEACTRPLTVVCAGPGWGKTTAVSRWLANRARSDVPVAWVTVQHSDTATALWGRILDALRGCDSIPPGHPLEALSVSGGLSDEVLTVLMWGLAALPTEFLLVLDDFHEASDPSISDVVLMLARRVPRVRIVLLTRETPSLPRRRLLQDGILTEVTAEHLAFTAPEVVQLARIQAVELTEVEVAALLTRTEGWPSGIRLALIQIERRGVGALHSFAGSERSVAEYLVAEVLEHNCPQVRDFLLRTSVVTQICGELAAQIAPEAPGQQILEMLEARNEFVTALGPDKTWFRYHPLLRDMLRYSLERDDPHGLHEAQRAAGRWWSTHGDPVVALRLSAAAGDWDMFADVYMTAAGPHLTGTRREELRECLNRVPFDSLPDSIESHLEQAGLALMAGQGAALAHHVGCAQQLLARGRPLAPAGRVLLALLASAAPRFIGDAPATVAAVADVPAILDSADPFPAADIYRGVVAEILAVGQLWSGDFEAADLNLAMALELPASTTAGAGLSALGARSHLALARLAQGRWGEAETLARQALASASVQGWSSNLQARPAHLTMAALHLMRGDSGLADSAIAAGLAAVRGGAEPPSTLWLLSLEAQLAVSRGRFRAARRAASLIEAARGDWLPAEFLTDVVEHALTDVALMDPGTGPQVRPSDEDAAGSPLRRTCRARRLLAAGHVDRAREVVSPVIALGVTGSLFDVIAQVDAWLVTALAADQVGAASEAKRATRHAVDLARPLRLVRPFLVTGSPRMAMLLRNSVTGQDDQFDRELSRMAAERCASTAEPDPLLEPLTERELAILRTLPTMKSNLEIADDFYVSTNTVKAHLKSMYRKLEVSGRREAVDRGRALGLIQ